MAERVGLCLTRKHYENGEFAFAMARRRVAPSQLTESQQADWLLGWDSANQRKKDSDDDN